MKVTLSFPLSTLVTLPASFNFLTNADTLFTEVIPSTSCNSVKIAPKVTSFPAFSITSNTFSTNSKFAFWFLVGGLAHIVEDSICGKIPIINPTKPKVHFRLFYTNTPFEYIFSFCISMLVLIAKVPTFAIFVKSSLMKIM